MLDALVEDEILGHRDLGTIEYGDFIHANPCKQIASRVLLG